MNKFGEFQPSLDFLSDLAMLAEQCVDNDADGVDIKIGPFDCIAMNVSIRFDYTKEDK